MFGAGMRRAFAMMGGVVSAWGLRTRFSWARTVAVRSVICHFDLWDSWLLVVVCTVETEISGSGYVQTRSSVRLVVKGLFIIPEEPPNFTFPILLMTLSTNYLVESQSISDQYPWINNAGNISVNSTSLNSPTSEFREYFSCLNPSTNIFWHHGTIFVSSYYQCSDSLLIFLNVMWKHFVLLYPHCLDETIDTYFSILGDRGPCIKALVYARLHTSRKVWCAFNSREETRVMQAFWASH